VDAKTLTSTFSSATTKGKSPLERSSCQARSARANRQDRSARKTRAGRKDCQDPAGCKNRRPRKVCQACETTERAHQIKKAREEAVSHRFTSPK
jgi:hypothetical protein